MASATPVPKDVAIPCSEPILSAPIGQTASYTGPYVYRRVSLSVICTVAEQSLPSPPAASGTPILMAGPGSTEQGTQEGLSKHLGKANRPLKALDLSRTAPETRDAAGCHPAPSAQACSFSGRHDPE